MKAEDAWIVGYLPGEFHVRGHKMFPLLFGHLAVMNRLICYPPMTESDIALCVSVCKRSYKDAENFMSYFKHSDRYQFELRDLLDEIMTDEKGWMESLMNYFKSHLVSLPIMEQGGEKKGDNLGSPSLALIRAFLCSRMNYDPLTFNDAPFHRCILDMQVLSEMDGRVKVQSPEIDKAIAVAKAYIEKQAKEREEEKQDGSN